MGREVVTTKQPMYVCDGPGCQVKEEREAALPARSAKDAGPAGWMDITVRVIQPYEEGKKQPPRRSLLFHSVACFLGYVQNNYVTAPASQNSIQGEPLSIGTIINANPSPDDDIEPLSQ